jgi:hypothetical protein
MTKSGPIISIATNVCVNDGVRIRHTLPHWLRVFGERAGEIVIVVDEEPRVNRMADRSHAVAAGAAELQAAVNDLAAAHPRVRVVRFNSRTETKNVNRKWFTFGDPVRCQSGSPIFGYLLAIEEASNDLILKVDCDMLFHECGWLDAASESLGCGAADLAEPWRLGLLKDDLFPVSSRAFLLHRQHFSARRLPLVPQRLDWLRRVHRFLHHRPPWQPLEVMLSREVRAGRARMMTLPRELGYSLHIPSRDDFCIPGFGPIVIASVETGSVPKAQWETGPNFRRTTWEGLMHPPSRTRDTASGRPSPP